MFALSRVVVRVGVVVVLHPDEEERGGRGHQRKHPQGQDDVLDPAFCHHHLGPEREADGQISLHAQGGDVEDGGISTALVDVVVKPTHRLAEHPGHVLPEAIEVKGQTEEDDQVRHGHAGQVEVGGSLHVFKALDDEDGHGVTAHSDDEDEDADDRDRDEGGGGEQ